MKARSLSDLAGADDPPAIRTLARSLFRRMQAGGYSHGQVVDFASALLGLVGDDYRGRITPARPSDGVR